MLCLSLVSVLLVTRARIILVRQMFEGGPAWRFTAPEEVARQVALRHVRPPFKASTYPLGVKE